MKYHQKHIEHFTEWYADNKHRHDLRCVSPFQRPLHQAQATAVEWARKLKASHILFTEDDQWGYPVDGLDVLLEADKDVIGFKTYSRRYPFCSLFLRKKEEGSMITRETKLAPVSWTGKEIDKVDLISWAFTLVRTDVFDKIDNPFEVWGKVPTDSYFAQMCAEAGIDIWGHFGFTIGHGDFGPEEIPTRRTQFELCSQTEPTNGLEVYPEKMDAHESRPHGVRGDADVGKDGSQGAIAAG